MSADGQPLWIAWCSFLCFFVYCAWWLIAAVYHVLVAVVVQSSRLSTQIVVFATESLAICWGLSCLECRLSRPATSAPSLNILSCGVSLRVNVRDSRTSCQLGPGVSRAEAGGAHRSSEETRHPPPLENRRSTGRASGSRLDDEDVHAND